MAKILATDRGKEKAIAALKKRIASKPEKIDNGKLPAGSPMYFYCRICDNLSDTKPENYTDQPKDMCAECKALENKGWLAEAINTAIPE